MTLAFLDGELLALTSALAHNPWLQVSRFQEFNPLQASLKAPTVVGDCLKHLQVESSRLA